MKPWNFAEGSPKPAICPWTADAATAATAPAAANLVENRYKHDNGHVKAHRQQKATQKKKERKKEETRALNRTGKQWPSRPKGKEKKEKPPTSRPIKKVMKKQSIGSSARPSDNLHGRHSHAGRVWGEHCSRKHVHWLRPCLYEGTKRLVDEQGRRGKSSQRLGARHFRIQKGQMRQPRRRLQANQQNLLTDGFLLTRSSAPRGLVDWCGDVEFHWDRPPPQFCKCPRLYITKGASPTSFVHAAARIRTIHKGDESATTPKRWILLRSTSQKRKQSHISKTIKQRVCSFNPYQKLPKQDTQCRHGDRYYDKLVCAP